MKKDNVLIVHNYYKVPGGEDSVVRNEEKLLRDNGHKVVIYSRDNREIDKKNILKKIMVPFESIFSIKTYREIKEIIKREKIEIVHVHNTLPLISSSVYYAAKNCGVPVVQTLHNFRLLCPGATFTKGNIICEECLEKGLMCAVKSRCYRQSFIQTIVLVLNLIFNRIVGTYNKVDAFISLTEFNKKKFIGLLPEDKIFVKPNFANQNYLENSDNEEKGYFLFLGRIDEIKGIDLLLESWKDIKDVKLLIVGKGPYEEKAKEYVKVNNMNNIEFLGYKDKHDVLEIISKAIALIIPSQCYEGFPMTIVESFSLSVPVIAGDIGNLSTIIKDGNNGLLFKYNSYKELSKRINDLLYNKELRLDLANGAKTDFNNKYNEVINYKILTDIYNSIRR